MEVCVKMETTRKLFTTILAIITGILLFSPLSVQAEGNSTPTGQVQRVEIETVGRIQDQVAPNISLNDIEGKVERGGSQLYSIVQTVVIYASYIGFAIGVLMTIFGFGRSGRGGGVILMLTSSVAFFFIGYGPETVAWLGQWFTNL